MKPQTRKEMQSAIDLILDLMNNERGERYAVAALESISNAALRAKADYGNYEKKAHNEMAAVELYHAVRHSFLALLSVKTGDKDSKGMCENALTEVELMMKKYEGKLS